jgi:hypothetical protein
MREIGLEDLKEAHRKASEEAIKQNRALGLTYIEVRDSKLVSISSDGHPTVIGKPRFGTRKVGLKRFRLEEKQKV